MAKLKDADIISLQKNIQLKKDRISKLKNKFTPETTCVYKTPIGVIYNLHVSNITNLLIILGQLNTDKNSFETACKIAKVTADFTYQGFTYEQWEKDILFLIDKINIDTMEKELMTDIEFLDTLISKDTKNKIKFDSILSKHSL